MSTVDIFDGVTAKVAPCPFCMTGELQADLDEDSLLEYPMNLLFVCRDCGHREVRNNLSDFDEELLDVE